MLAASFVILLGFGLGALGLLWNTLFDIAIPLIFVGFVGVVVRLPDAVRWLRE